MSSDENTVSDVKVLEHLGDSDHNIIVCSLILDVGLSNNKQPMRKYHKADYVAMRNWFSEIDWAQECDELDVEEMWQKLCLFIDQAVNMFVPVGYNKSWKNPRWMNQVAKSARKYKSRMWDRDVG